MIRHANFKDLTGQKFGMLTAIEPAGLRAQNGSVRWWVTCDCGSKTICSGGELLAGIKVNCGCMLLAKKTSNRRRQYEFFKNLDKMVVRKRHK